MSARESPTLPQLVEEAQRVLSICNACRYCEGYCAVFPALERRLSFDEGDVHYLANLCHNCGSCLYACQYAPPHEFQLNFPRVLAQVRKQTYRKYAWPAFLGAAFERNGVVVALLTMASLAALLLFCAWLAGAPALFAAYSDEEGAFYAVMPHAVMAGVFGIVFLFAIVSRLMSFTQFWDDTGAVPGPESIVPLRGATWDAAGLTYLDGGGIGCTYPDERPSFARRNFHHLTFYGFLLCFGATVAGTIYHYVFAMKAPYPFYSLPVILGTLGGIGLIVGPIGLMVLRARRDPDLGDRAQDGMDSAFLVLLLLTSATGLGLLAWREAHGMGVLLALHLGAVMALFLTMPYGKLVHAVYRFAALLRFHVERRRSLPQVGAE